jgi:flavoprotein
MPALEELTRHAVRSQYKLPREPDAWPPADAAILAPATFNTINQWALGITEKFIVGFVAEAISKGIPTVTMPCVNAAYVQHTQFDTSVATLREWGCACCTGKADSYPTSRARADRRTIHGTWR